jgi:hypothetical protein
LPPLPPVQVNVTWPDPYCLRTLPDPSSGDRIFKTRKKCNAGRQNVEYGTQQADRGNVACLYGTANGNECMAWRRPSFAATVILWCVWDN